MKACPICASVGDVTYCQECRKRGKIVLMLDRRGLEAALDNLRKQAAHVKNAIAALGE